MKIYTVVNGSTSVVLSPETEVEKLLLKSIFDNPAGIVVKSHEKLDILDIKLVDAFVITSKGKEDGNK